jgi:isoquinoline 1-oxidoreductase
MTTGTQAVDEGLTIKGEVSVGFPPTGGYASVVYSNTKPSVEIATWLSVRPDGTATAYAGKVEYGQNIRTGFAIEVADELRLPVDRVEVVLGDTDRVPWDAGTFGSQSTWKVGLQLRKAAATARQALLELAADRLDLPLDELEAREGRVISRRDPNRAVSYAALLSGQRLEREIDENAPLTPAGQFTVMGKRWQRFDAVERVTGKAIYSQDVQRPGMLFAKVLRPPSYGATLVELVAVLAESDEQGELAAQLLRAQWQERTDHPSQWDMPDLLVRTAKDTMVMQEAGSLDEGFRQADGILEALYYTPYVTNAPMEPRAAVAEWQNGRLTVWAGGQRPFGIRAELAGYFDIPLERVRVITTEIGGGFGSKSYYPVALEAARLAKIAGRPVRVAFTRVEDTVWSTFRPAAFFEVKSGFKADGAIVAWQFRAYHAGDRAVIARRGSECPYDVPHIQVVVSCADSPLRAGSYRSLGGAVNHFARESHIDEIAAAVGMDPVELRLRNLRHPRFRRVLEAAATRFGWTGAKPPSGRGFGASIGLDVGSYCAACVEVDVQGSEVRVSRIAAALDCGLVVNPEGAINQVEGSLIMGMGLALYEAIDFEGGRVLNAGFARYRVPRITNTPAIDVALVGDPDVPSTGAGEPAIVTTAGSIANAVFDRTGIRVRELPIQRHLR